MRVRPAPGGGREVTLDPARLPGWVGRFTDRHGAVRVSEVEAGAAVVTFRADDGASARAAVPFPPLAAPFDGAEAGVEAVVAALVEHALAPRRVGVLLVRLGGYAVGVFAGEDLVAAKVGARQVHGRSAAGGWSQQRFARRREGQVRVALGAAADAAAAVLLPEAARLDAVVLGGDRGAADAVLADPRLASLRALVAAPHLDVPDPRRRVLEDTPRLFRAVRVVVTDPPEIRPGTR